MALAEVRKRAMSKSGVAEHASSGFSPLKMTDQKQRDEARQLLGRELVDADASPSLETGPWYDKALFLLASLAIIVGGIAYFAWPLNEDEMRARAEKLLAQESRSSLSQARISYLEPMLSRFPDGEHVSWAQEQLDRVQMVEAEHAMSVKLNRNLPLKNEAERLYSEAQRYERFGDVATALDQYRSMVTLFGGEEMEHDPAYRPFVNLARRQIATIENKGIGSDEASRIVQAKLSEAEKEFDAGNVVAARRIWYSIIELYGNNTNVAPLVTRAQERIASSKSPLNEPVSSSPQ
jgi:eukaryotic-like serine/threonine-protein kinase